jgi:hypothetical protein
VVGLFEDFNGVKGEVLALGKDVGDVYKSYHFEPLVL